MPRNRKRNLIKVRLLFDGEDTETPWAEDLGPVRGAGPGARRVRLANVPFLHAKPTWGDVIIVEPDPDDGVLTWDCRGVQWERVGTRIERDSGRWAMVLDYRPLEGAELSRDFDLLCKSAEEIDVIPEGCLDATNTRPGRLYLAVPDTLGIVEVLDHLYARNLPLTLKLIHPLDD